MAGRHSAGRRSFPRAFLVRLRTPKLAVLTGMRPSEQVALKWSAVDDRFIHVELSRVRNLEKAELKTAPSNRRIEIRSSMKKVLDDQQTLMANLQSPYVFLNMEGKPILQDKLRELVDESNEEKPASLPENV